MRAALLSALVLSGCAGSAVPTPAAPDFPVPANAPPAPDYTQRATWLATGDGTSGVASIPIGSGLSDLEASSDVDVFYLSPTTAADVLVPEHVLPAQLNEAWDDISTQGLALEIAQNQATPFNGGARVFAPYYRQAKMNVWLYATAAQAQPAADLAYIDVKASFDYYLAHYNAGRPIILAGHSQGSLMAYRLMADEFDGKPLYAKLVAAYIPGQPVNANYFGSFKQIHACAGATDTGCINSWASFDFDASQTTLANFANVCFYWTNGVGNAFAGPTLPMHASINPLTWTSSAAAVPAAQNMGALTTSILYPYLLPGVPIPMGSLVPATYGVRTYGQTSDYSSFSTLVSPHLDPSWFAAYFGPFPVPFDGVWHLYDFNIYWMNIRQNTRDRGNAYLIANGAMKPLISGPIAVTVGAGAPMHISVTTMNAATVFSADGLPQGVTIDTSGGISGTPAAGVYPVILHAANAWGTSSGELALTAR